MALRGGSRSDHDLETWDGVAADGQPRAISLNHYAFGVVDDWLVRQVADIRPARPGYGEITFAPDLTAPFGTVRASVGTPFGDAGIRWSIAEGVADIDISVPGNTSATLHLPAGETQQQGPGRHHVSLTGTGLDQR